MKAFKVSGTFKMRPGIQKFTKEVAAEDQRAAVEQVLSDLGSKHKVKRNEISVEGVAAIDPTEVSDAVVRHRLQS
jgi:large subunit ribosomal protein LX